MSGEFSGRVFGVFETPSNQKRIDEIEQLGGEVFRLPSLTIHRLDDESEIVNAVGNLSEFDWIFFTDIYCVDIFLEVLEERGVDPFELDNLTVCAFGEVVADRLRFSQVHSDLIPSTLSADAIGETLRLYASGTEGLDYKRALFLYKEELAKSVADLLRNRFDEFLKMEVYRSHGTSPAETTKLKTLLKGGACDEIVLFSEEDVQSLIAIAGEASAEQVLSSIVISTSESRVFQSLRENELNSRLNSV